VWSYVARRLLASIPVYLGILLIVMVALRVNDPVYAYLPKNATREDELRFRTAAGLDRPFPEQYVRFLGQVVTFDLTMKSWDKPGSTVKELIADAIVPSLAISVPALVLTTLVSIVVGLLAAFYRGRWIDRALVIAAVLGMSVSFLVYILLGQYFGAFQLNQAIGHPVVAVQGYDTGRPGWWVYYCLLPVLISTVVAMGYDTRFYRTVMVEECGKDYLRTARAKGLSERTVLFKHMLRNAMVNIVTHVMITFPFLIMGSILLEMYFNIPGMGKMLITALTAKDFPVVQGFTALFAALFLVSNILTDVLYAVVDPRVRLS
jgi:peptide/nickel transport system permease protein